MVGLTGKVALLCVSVIQCVRGHGWMTQPVSRNELAHKVKFPEGGKFRWEPQSSAGGNSCGNSEPIYLEGSTTWEKWYDASRGLAMPTLTPGADLPFSASITADHGGQGWLMIACADHFSEDADWKLLERAAGDRKHHIMSSNPHAYVWGVGLSGGTLVASYAVPKDLSCPSSRGIGRWVWKTGNSCIDADNVGRHTERFSFEEYKSVVSTPVDRCFSAPETFVSCFDFQIAGASSASPTSAPQTVTPTLAPTSQFTFAPTLVRDACVPVGDCGGTSWCNQAAYVLWCSSHVGESNCPAPFCKWEPKKPSTWTPAPQPTRPPAPTAAPTRKGDGCKANKMLNRGVTDSACQRCTTGYKWWPCNEAILCVGSGCIRSGNRLVEAKRRGQFLGTAPSLMQKNDTMSRVGSLRDHSTEEL